MTGRIRVDADGVHIPVRVARQLLPALLVPLAAAVRASTTQLDPTVAQLLHALNAAQQPPAPMSATGRAAPPPRTLKGMQTPRAASAATGLSSRQVRRLAAAGLIASERVGARCWLVDLESLHDYLRAPSRVLRRRRAVAA